VIACPKTESITIRTDSAWRRRRGESEKISDPREAKVRDKCGTADQIIQRHPAIEPKQFEDSDTDSDVGAATTNT
jgi:hypothetical protein